MWKEIGLVVKKIHFLLSGTKVSYLWHKSFLPMKQTFLTCETKVPHLGNKVTLTVCLTLAMSPAY